MVIRMKFDRHSKAVKTTGLVAAGLFILFLIYHFTGSKPLVIPPPAVVVQKPVMNEVVEYVTQTGTTVAYNAVNLVARIEGYLDSIGFVDGTFVKKGQQLFLIQPEPYLQQLLAAKATVAAYKASNEYNEAEYARQKRMYRENATSLNNVEKWKARTLESQAQIAKAVADAEVAAINYSYTHVTSPFDGRIGRHLVDPGNLVGHGEATELATVQQISPIYVYFNLNEIDLLKLREAWRANGFKPSDINTVPVGISLQDSDGFKYKGKLDFVNTGLNASTGTMELRAILDNKSYDLVPGLFVQVRIAVSKPQKQLTVPATAILNDQIGPYLFTVDETNIVQIKRVKLGAATNGWQAIATGLDATDRVVVSGLQNASPGIKVAPQEQVKGKQAA